MKKLIFLLLFTAVVCFATDIEKEKEAIKKTIQTAYVEGLQNEGDLEKIDKGFHSCFKLLGLKDGTDIWELPISEWKEKTKKRKEKGAYPKTGDKKVSVEFEMIDITGNAAIAKFKFFAGNKFKYVDYLSLYKFNDGWKIVGKIYHEIK